jgi:hypothetical protein
VLEARIQQAFTRPQYRPAALRIIHALSVHRLTTSDIYAPIGATAEELRDDLCLLLPLPERDAEFLKTSSRPCSARSSRPSAASSSTSTGERPVLPRPQEGRRLRLAHREEGRVAERRPARSLLLRRTARVVLEDPEARPTSGYRIWEHELEWRERKAGRSGYLFFGAPNERSTAQPQRDFYIYFLQPFEPPYFKDERKSDEVFFRLTLGTPSSTCAEALRGRARAGGHRLGQQQEDLRRQGARAPAHADRWLQEKLTTVSR